MANLDIDNIRELDTIKVKLINESGAGGSEIISSFLLDDFGFSSAANYTSPFETQTEKVSNQLNGVMSTLRAVTGGDSSEGEIQNIQLKTKVNSTYVWSSSDRPVFTFPLLFISIHPGEDVRVPAMRLHRAEMPMAEGPTEFLKAPNNYGARVYEKPDGTWTLSIGRWFRAPNLVITSVDTTFSRAQTPDGYPLFCQANVTLEPYRVVSREEMESFFRASGNTHPGVR